MLYGLLDVFCEIFIVGKVTVPFSYFRLTIAHHKFYLADL